jgi:hypothetical protein
VQLTSGMAGARKDELGVKFEDSNEGRQSFGGVKL